MGASCQLPSTPEVHQMYFFRSSTAWCDLIDPVQTLGPRVFRLEDNMMTLAKVRAQNSKKKQQHSYMFQDIGEIKCMTRTEMGELKGQMGTVRWQLGVLLALGLGGGGSVGS